MIENVHIPIRDAWLVFHQLAEALKFTIKYQLGIERYHGSHGLSIFAYHPVVCDELYVVPFHHTKFESQ